MTHYPSADLYRLNITLLLILNTKIPTVLTRKKPVKPALQVFVTTTIPSTNSRVGYGYESMRFCKY